MCRTRLLPVLVAVLALIAGGCATTGSTSGPTHHASPATSARRSRAARERRVRAQDRRAQARRERRAERGRASTTTTAPSPPTAADSLLVEPSAGLVPIYRLIRSARRAIDLTMYELSDPTAEGLLDAAAARGVDVRVVLDTNRERARNEAAFGELAAHGVHVHWAPASYAATHEKALTVDGRVAVVMTLNLTSEYYNDTRDFAVIDRDTKDVAAIDTVFDADYAGTRPPVMPGGADLVWSPGAGNRLETLIGRARHSLLVENEEMSDWDIVDALLAAARRGVKVTVVMTSDGEYDKEFSALAGAGATVRVYPEDASRYIHAKAIVVDGRTVWVGSQNFSYASLDDNRELGLVLSTPAVVAGVSRTIEADAAGGKPFWPERSRRPGHLVSGQ